MQRLLYVAALAAFVSICSSAQTPDPLPAQLNNTTEQVEVYYGGPGVTLPKLLTSPETPAASGKCHNKQEARVSLSLVVDSQGRPRNMIFDRPVGNEFDEFALMILEKDRFYPGTYQGNPAAVGLTVEIHLQACVEKTKDATGKKTEMLRLHSMPEQHFKEEDKPPQEVTLAPADPADTGTAHLGHLGRGVTAPKPILQSEAQFSDYARTNKIQGTCVVSLIVDAHGMPQNIHITRSIEPSLDENAIESVRKYRFKPAMRNGMPVPVAISVEVRFRLY